MGRVRTADIKKFAFVMLKRYPDIFGKDFKANKKSLNELGVTGSKRTKNKVAGYIIRAAGRKA